MDYIELPAETYGNFMGVQEKDKQKTKPTPCISCLPLEKS